MYRRDRFDLEFADLNRRKFLLFLAVRFMQSGNSFRGEHQ